MVDLRELSALINRRTGKVLMVAEMVLPPETFTGLRKIILDEFGRNGLLGEVARLERQDK